MAQLMQAHNQWASRPDDERFTSLYDMHSHFMRVREYSRAAVVSSRRVQALPTEDNKGLLIAGPTGTAYEPTHWAFGQVAQFAEAPAGYLRTLPAPIAADCINYGLQYKRDVEEVPGRTRATFARFRHCDGQELRSCTRGKCRIKTSGSSWKRRVARFWNWRSKLIRKATA